MLLSYTDEETQLIVICNLQVRYLYDDHNGFTKCIFCILMTNVHPSRKQLFLVPVFHFPYSLKIGEEYSFAEGRCVKLTF